MNGCGMEAAECRARVDERISRLEAIVESQDQKLDEVLQLLHASKLGLGALKGLIYLGLAIVGAWAAFKGVR
jgi:flagellar motor switch protein FliG